MNRPDDLRHLPDLLIGTDQFAIGPGDSANHLSFWPLAGGFPLLDAHHDMIPVHGSVEITSVNEYLRADRIIGHENAIPPLIEANSPLNQVHHLRYPIFVTAGTNDVALFLQASQ